MLPGGANLHPVKGNGGLQQVVRDAKAITQQEGQLAPIGCQLAAQLVDVLPYWCSMGTCSIMQLTLNPKTNTQSCLGAERQLAMVYTKGM